LNINAFETDDVGSQPKKTFEPDSETAMAGSVPTSKHTMPIYKPNGHFTMPNHPIDNTRIYSLLIYKPE